MFCATFMCKLQGTICILNFRGFAPGPCQWAHSPSWIPAVLRTCFAGWLHANILTFFPIPLKRHLPKT